MRVLNKLLARLLAQYQVVVIMDCGKVARHYAASYAEALDWLQCYPASDCCAVFESLLGCAARKPVAARFTA